MIPDGPDDWLDWMLGMIDCILYSVSYTDCHSKTIQTTPVLKEDKTFTAAI